MGIHSFSQTLFSPENLLLAAAEVELVRTWDSPMVIVLKLGAIMCLVLLNGFFVASEFAIVKVRSSQLDALLDQGHKTASLARHVTSHMDAYLSATQLGITLASLGLGFLGEPFLAQMLHPFMIMAGITSEPVIKGISFGIAFTLVTFLHIVFGELAPKSIAIRKALQTTLVIAAPLKVFHFIFKPAIWFLNGAANLFLKKALKIDPVAETELAHSEEELRMILTQSEKSQEVTPLGKELLLNALDLRRRVVRDIMTPRGDVVYLDLEDPLEENLNVARDAQHTRLPLCLGHLDNTVGLVHIKDLFSLDSGSKPNLESIKRELVPVPEMMPLEKLLTFFLSKKVHLGVVVDEFGGTVGVVSLDDVLAELVGEIHDEFDEMEEEFTHLNEREFEVDGTYGLHELNELADLDLKSSDVSTIGGYVTHILGHLPKVGETLTIENYLVTITKADGRRIESLHFHRQELAKKTED